MLTEFALTPEVFDEGANPDLDAWREQLIELGFGMFPRNTASPIVVANLGDDGWMIEAETIVRQVKDHRLKQLCQSLLIKVNGILVRRPLLGDWPQDEVGWAREAAAHHEVPIDRIVATTSAREALACEGCKVRSLDEVQGNGFWSGISATAAPRMDIAEQIDLLRKLSLHADFISFVSPRIYGGGDDEVDFAIALARSCYSRPPGYSSPEVEIHTDGPNDAGAADYGSRLSSIATAIESRMRAGLHHGQKLKLFFWPRKLLHRRIVAGVNVQASSGALTRSPRWGLAMDHVARRTDDPGKLDAAAWHLLPREAVGDLFSQLSLTDNPAPHVVDVVV